MFAWDWFAFYRSAPHGPKRPFDRPPFRQTSSRVSVVWEMVIMPQSNPFASGESRIVDVRSDLSRISKDRLLAYRKGRIVDAAGQQSRSRAPERRNGEAIASSV